MFGCLAYTESLGDPDTEKSVERSKQLLGDDYNKSRGVKFYYDDDQNREESRWNVGLYQFVLDRSGNISPCITAWKKLKLPGSSKINSYDYKKMGNVIGSPAQSFNSFCGVNKILQSYLVQVYSNDKKRTHPENLLANGKLKKPENRCVTLHHNKKVAYAHFGPLQRSVLGKGDDNTNLRKVLECVSQVN